MPRRSIPLFVHRPSHASRFPWARRSLFAALVALSCAASTVSAQAQGIAPRENPSVRIRGSGPESWVLLSGLVGGVDGMRKLEARLLSRGYRVVTIDVYRLSIDSADVSFATMARRVDALLADAQVEHAHVVGHAHGGGVALRLAASYPARVSAVDLLDVGALPESSTKVLGSALGLLPLLVHMPGGRAFLRSRFERGILENSGETDWFSADSRHTYIDPILEDMGRVVAMARRLRVMREPEAVETLLTRVRVPVTMVLGDAPHTATPSARAMRAIASLGGLLRVVHLPTAGHFPHEEMPDQLMQSLVVPRLVER